MKVLMIVNDTNFAWNLRREVMLSFVEHGWETYLIANELDHCEEFKNIGVHVENISIDRRGKNPLKDIRLFFSYLKCIKKIKPDIAFINNTKPNIFGGLACRMRHVQYVSNVTGLGTAVEIPNRLQKLSIWLYKIGVKGARTLFFQNKENRAFFENHNMIGPNTRVVMLPGSGVNLSAHPLLPWNDEEVHFLFAARIMKEKGIDMFLSVARKMATKGIVFDVCGQCDDPHYLSVLDKEKSIVYHGLQKDMTPFYQKCSCFLYPSYYPEGMSNVCLEAAASGRPLIVADRAGCRETVDDGISGYIVPIHDEKLLYSATEKFLSLSNEERISMGLSGRAKMEREFDRDMVVSAYIDEVKRV